MNRSDFHSFPACHSPAAPANGSAQIPNPVFDLLPRRITLPEAIGLLGAPDQIALEGDGITIVRWSRITKNHITGHCCRQQIEILFDSDGRMERLLQY